MNKSLTDIPRDDWPPLDEAMRIIDRDLAAMPGAPVCIHLRQDGDAWIGSMWQQAPDGSRCGQFGVVARSQQDAIRHMAAVIKRWRIGYVDVGVGG